MTPIRIARVDAFAFRVPLAAPIKVAFGTFRDRPAVYVRVVDDDGVEGWGEAWCNWPSVGAEHRARLVADFGTLLVGETFAGPEQVLRWLEARLEVLVLQTGEIGPIAQALAGIDIAVWDVAARKQGKPLYALLGAAPAGTVPVYATGINPDGAVQFALERQREGHRAFKLKVGFGREIDVRNVRALRDALGEQAVLMVDANQGMNVESAAAFAEDVAEARLRWLEEPLRVDRPAAEWQTLARRVTVPLAGGENLRGPDLQEAATGDVLQVLQPDITKWGGITGNLALARDAVARGKAFCPHVFGGGIALIASLHLLA